MSTPQRIVRVSVGAFMVMTCALGMSGFTAASAAPAATATPAAHHPPHQRCPRGHKGHYPPGKCRVFFNRSSYHPGEKVKFETGEVFKSHEKVTETLFCHHGTYVHKYGTDTAGKHGRVRDTIKLSQRVPTGGCTLTLKGKKSGVILNSHIRVKKETG